METAVAGTPTRPVEDSVRTTFRQSKRALRSAASLVSNALKGTPPKTDPDDIADTLEAIKKEETQEIEGVVTKLGERIGSIPDDHFDRLSARFETALASSVTPGDGSNRSA
jgi:hypothetical protein